MKSKLALNIEQRKRDLGIATNLELSKLSGVSRAVITNIQLQPDKSNHVRKWFDVSDSIGLSYGMASHW